MAQHSPVRSPVPKSQRMSHREGQVTSKMKELGWTPLAVCLEVPWSFPEAACNSYNGFIFEQMSSSEVSRHQQWPPDERSSSSSQKPRFEPQERQVTTEMKDVGWIPRAVCRENPGPPDLSLCSSWGCLAWQDSFLMPFTAIRPLSHYIPARPSTKPLENL